jgi:hypothetical protein
MRRRLFRLATAGLLAVGVVLPTTAQPAAAFDPGSVVTVLKQIYALYQQFAKPGGLTLAQAVSQIEQAIQTAQQNIIDQINLVAVAGVQACARSAVINFADINSFTPDTLQTFVFNTTDCVTQAQSLIPAVTATPSAVDAAGFAMNTVGPIALMARAKAGLTTTGLKSALTAGDNSLIAALRPPCHQANLNGDGPPAIAWDCTAYNGDESEILISRPNARTMAENGATRNTSRAVAQAALPALAT